MPRSVFNKTQAWLNAAAIGLLTTAASIDTVRAGDKGLSLADLAGSYAGKAVGFLTICLTSNLASPAACANLSSVPVQFNHTELIQGSQSADGKFCATVTAINSPADGSRAPALVDDLIAAGSVTSYDPTTGKGKSSIVIYAAAPDVSCKGATVVNPRPAQPVAHLATDFTAGEEPALHTDDVYRSFTSVDGSYGGAVLGNTLYIQHK
jgi:hypothetical protein